MFWKEDHVAGIFKNIRTVAIYCRYMKDDAFAWFFQQIFEKKIQKTF